MATTIIRLPEVISRTGLPRSSIYQKISIGTFPGSITLGPRAVGWINEEIDQWIEECIRKARTPDEMHAEKKPHQLHGTYTGSEFR
jgi:prophage regulatory protein